MAEWDFDVKEEMHYGSGCWLGLFRLVESLFGMTVWGVAIWGADRLWGSPFGLVVGIPLILLGQDMADRRRELHARVLHLKLDQIHRELHGRNTLKDE